jgi:hypothetical protein
VTSEQLSFFLLHERCIFWHQTWMWPIVLKTRTRDAPRSSGVWDGGGGFQKWSAFTCCYKIFPFPVKSWQLCQAVYMCSLFSLNVSTRCGRQPWFVILPRESELWHTTVKRILSPLANRSPVFRSVSTDKTVFTFLCVHWTKRIKWTHVCVCLSVCCLISTFRLWGFITIFTWDPQCVLSGRFSFYPYRPVFAENPVLT